MTGGVKKRIVLTLLFLIANVAVLFAQGALPCNDGDIDENCPLDTWVIVLAAGALLFTVLHLYRTQKAVSKISVTNK
jgi:hypothetical protein